jgi:glycosyltransferase involved in cell wall biosynthesis
MLSLLADASIGIALRKYKGASLNERYADPGKLLEYAAAGVPVLCSNQESLEFVQREGWGACVDPESPAEIGAAVRRMLSDPRRLEAMGRSARKLFEERYCMERQVQPILDALSR